MKCTKMRLAAGLHPDPLAVKLERFPSPIRETNRFVIR